MATATRAPASRPTPAGGSPGGRRRSLLQRRQARTAWLLSLPFLLLFAAFTVGPVFASLLMSVTDMRSTDVRTPFAVDFAGFDNYTALFQDELFRKVAVNTAIFVVVGVPLTMALALAAAVGLNRITRLKAFFRLGFSPPGGPRIVAGARP